ncbi:transposase [Niabella ginsenosidivorans]|nr:transposase [Niabella ginsenosidivorans]
MPKFLLLFLLEQSLNLWKVHQQQLLLIDKRIEGLLCNLEHGKQFITSEHKAKPIRHHKPMITGLHQKLLNIYGADASCIPGITDYTLLKLLGEVGADMSRFPTAKHFVSWCGLCPGHNQSGLKNRKSKMNNHSNAGQTFREIAQALLNSKYVATGAFIRKLKSRKNARIAIKAGARKIAEAFYNLLTKGTQYVEQGIAKYEQQLKQREQNYLQKLALKQD